MSVEHFLARTMSKDPAQRPQSMQAFGEELRWLQQELGFGQTPLEVASSAPSRSEAPHLTAPPTQRGPVITTVRADSRRATRALRATAGSSSHLDEISQSRSGGMSSALKGALIGGGIGLAVIVAGVIALFALKVF